ncbi:ABC transporter ATP-binding protein [Clostridium sp. BJN0001]|uniref:ABC transporter ATP-binding protein n=1 Tax=Clostridium sp. BJN0001 TaxID=2930219 RepID=UPI001FD44B48|nr:ABC transporter ATP-binding protein [Clostridium sp. BJN0001]
MIDINNISFKIDGNTILKDISFKAKKGSILGIIGKNGAGKTTLLRILTGIYRSNSGEVLYDGENVYDNPDIKSKIGYVADENIINSRFKVKEVVKYYKYSYKNFDEKKFEKLNKIFEIPLERYIFNLSKGMKMRLSIMLSLSIHAEFLIFDEPTSGLDAILKKKLLEILSDEVLENETTIIISSHHLNELERICDNIVILKDEKIAYKNSIENMKNLIKKIQCVFNDNVIIEEFEKMDEIVAVSKVGRIYTIVTEKYDDKFLEKLKKFNPLFIEEVDLSLEDIFIYKVQEKEK